MARFALQHRVARIQRAENIYDVDADDEVEVYRIADVLAEFSTASSWGQDLTDHQAGRIWTRGVGSPWTDLEGSPTS